MSAKIPLMVRVVCRRCIFNGNHFQNPALICTAHGGLMPAVWAVYLGVIRVCGTAKFKSRRRNCEAES